MAGHQGAILDASRQQQHTGRCMCLQVVGVFFLLLLLLLHLLPLFSQPAQRILFLERDAVNSAALSMLLVSLCLPGQIQPCSQYCWKRK